MALPLSYTRGLLGRPSRPPGPRPSRHGPAEILAGGSHLSSGSASHGANPGGEWGVQDSNLRRHCHQIYSLTPLTARETPRTWLLKIFVGDRPCQIAPIVRNVSRGVRKQRGISLRASGGT